MASDLARLFYGAAAFLLFAAAAVHGPFGAARIERALEKSATARLKAAQIDWPVVSVSGRTVHLAGVALAPEEVGRAINAAAGRTPFSGVARVEASAVTIASTATDLIAAEALRFRAALNLSTLTLEGMAPSEAAIAFLLAPYNEDGAPVVSRNLAITPATDEADWTAAAAAGMQALALLDQGALTQQGGAFVLEGVAADATAAQTAESLLAGAQGGFRLTARLSIADPTHIAKACEAAIRNALNGEIVTFEASSAALNVSDRAVLTRLAKSFSACPGLTIRIEGHTDSNGGAQVNQRLSQRRAAAVRDFLASAGVTTPFIVAAYGEARPIASNRTAAGQRRNRRIDFAVVSASTGLE